MKFKNQLEMKVKSLSEAFSDLLETEYRLKIVTKDGNISVISSELLRFFSPIVNSFLNYAPCCPSSLIFIPDVSKASIDHVLNIIRTGITNLCSLSYEQIQEVKETARMLQIDLTDLSTVMVPDKESVTGQSLKLNMSEDMAQTNTIYKQTVIEDNIKEEFGGIELSEECIENVPKVEEISDKDVRKVEDIGVKDVPKYKSNREDQLSLERPKRRRSRWDVPPPPPTTTLKHEEIHGKVVIKTECPEYFEFHEDYETSGVRLKMKEEPISMCESEIPLVQATLGTKQIKSESLDKTTALKGDKEKNIDMKNDSASQFFFVKALTAPPDSDADTEPSSSGNPRPAQSQSKKRKFQNQGKSNTKNAKIEAGATKIEDEETINNLDVNNFKNFDEKDFNPLQIQGMLSTSKAVQYLFFKIFDEEDFKQFRELFTYSKGMKNQLKIIDAVSKNLHLHQGNLCITSFRKSGGSAVEIYSLGYIQRIYTYMVIYEKLESYRSEYQQQKQEIELMKPRCINIVEQLVNIFSHSTSDCPLETCLARIEDSKLINMLTFMSKFCKVNAIRKCLETREKNPEKGKWFLSAMEHSSISNPNTKPKLNQMVIDYDYDIECTICKIHCSPKVMKNHKKGRKHREKLNDLLDIDLTDQGQPSKPQL